MSREKPEKRQVPLTLSIHFPDEDENPSRHRFPEDELRTPEQYVGAILDTGGARYRIDSLKPSGDNMIAFSLTNIETGESKFVMQMFRSDFDHKKRLAECLNEATDQMPDSADRVIKVCNMLLAIDPRLEAAAFNKGVALMVKGDCDGALASFDHAIAILPDDPWNWIQKAGCLAMFRRDREAVESLLVAARLDRRGTRERLAGAKALAEVICGAVERALSRDPADAAASEAMRCFRN